MRRRASGWVCALVLLLLGVRAGDPARAEEPAKAAPAAAPATPEAAADSVPAALAAKDEAALKALAARDDPDPWLVADELVARGEHDAAAAFAKAAPRVDTEGLPAYVQAAKGRAPETAERKLIAALNEVLKARKFEDVVQATGEKMDPIDTVARVRVQSARGRALGYLSRWVESASVLKRAADAALALGWTRRAADLYEAVTTATVQVTDWAGTLAGLEVLLPLQERRGNPKGAAQALGRIGYTREQAGDHARALAAYEQTLARYEAMKDDEGISWIWWNVSALHRTQGEPAKEIEALERAVPAYEAIGNRVGTYDTLNLMGIAHAGLGDQAKALAIHVRALALAEALGDKIRTSGSLVNLGNTHFALQDLPSARLHYERGLALADEVGQHDWSRNALNSLGRMHYELGELSKAFAVYQDLRERRQALKDEAGAAHWLLRIGTVHARRGDYAKALSAYEQALSQQERLGLKADAASTLNHMGIAYQGLGEFAKALSAHEQALARQEALGDKAGQSAELINMGNVHQSLGDLATAASLFQRGLDLATEIGHRQWRANAVTNIGTVYLNSGEPWKALQAFERGLAEDEAVGNRSATAGSLANIGSAHLMLGEPAKGVVALERALKIEESLGDQAGAADTLALLGQAHLQLGNEKKAFELLERSTQAARSRRLAPLLLFALKLTADAHLRAGDSARALRCADEGLQVAEGLLGRLGDEQGALARAKYADLFAIGATAAVREKDAGELFRFLESGRAGALLDSLDQREALRWKAEALSPELQRLDLEARAKERAARDAYDLASRGEDRNAVRDAGQALDEATDAVRAVTNRIQRELKQSALFYPRARTLDDIRTALAKDQALVIYGLCLGEVVALVVRRDGERIVSLGDTRSLVEACETLDANDPDADVKSGLESLRKRLVDPLDLGEGVRQVLVSPEGPLCYLPFAALFSQPVAMTPSGTTHVLLFEERRKPGQGVLALGDPDYGGVSDGARAIYYRGRALSRLPATRAEATTIGTVTLLGAEASESGFYAAVARSNGWRAVHFACHGLVNPTKPMVSSLALARAGDADGFLTASEVLRTKIPADLAVLSACESATGSIVGGEGIVGLTRAFMFAGSPRVICSLWKVDDAATSALMVKFYELWNPKDGSKGLPTAEALRAAQEHVRSQEKWKHPYYWAAWVLWGLPD